MDPERSIGSILQGIVANVRELVQSEIALAKREVVDSVQRGKAAAAALVVGAVVLLIGVHFLLWAGVYALALRLPLWAATGIVSGVFLVVGAVAVSIGLKRWQLVSFTPERTVASLKETAQWVKQSTR